MATYKVLQDIEAEDKLLGPLTLRQFGFAGIVAISGYITFLLFSKGAWFLSIPLWPVIVIFGFLAFPFGRDQPNEIWLLAKLRFFLKPRQRIWDQEGLEELVTITVPKKVDDSQLTKDFDREEAKSRLKALASTIDSRGWAVKNANVNLFAQQPAIMLQASQDRLMGMSSVPIPQPITDVTVADDVLDEHSKTADQLNQLLVASEQAHKNQILEQMHSSLPPAPVVPTPPPMAQTPSTSITTADEKALLEKIHKEQSAPKPASHLRTIQPLGAKQKAKKEETTVATKGEVKSSKPTNNTGSTAVNPAILALADNDDLNVATIAREAHKATGTDDPNEVVISLR